MEEQEGYDMANTMFNPEGRLRQLEYAAKATKKGSPVIGMVCKEGAVLLVHRTVSNSLRIPRSEQKIEKVADHIAVGVCGIASDGVTLIESSQLEATNHWINFDAPIDVRSIAAHVGEILQSYTQFSGLRPYGVALVIAGVDTDGPSIYVTDASGTYYGYRAICVGQHDEAIKEILRTKHTSDMGLKDVLALGLDAFKTVYGKEFSADSVQGMHIPMDCKAQRLTSDDIKAKKAKK